MTKQFVVVSALFCLVLSGCVATGKPMTWKDEGFSFTNQYAFVIKPVQNKTGKTFQEDIPAILDANLKIEFAENGLTVIDDADNIQDVLYLESELIVYVEGSAFKRWLAPGAGKTQCTLKSRLIDRSNKKVAEIVTAKEVGAGGLYSVGADKSILKDAASDIAVEVVKLISD